MNKKIITFCVFGDNPVFLKGAIENAKLAQQIYPDWISRFYLFQECHFLKNDLQLYNNIEIELIDKQGGFYSTMYRFLPLGESDVERFISRDTDSRLSIREKEAVDEWINDDCDFHIMKDHPYHYTPEYPILAGMWGAKGGLIPNIKEYIDFFIDNNTSKKGIDQFFLYDLFHKKIEKYTEHDMDTFPSPRNYERDRIYFVGQPFDENNNFYGDWKNDLNKLNISL